VNAIPNVTPVCAQNTPNVAARRAVPTPQPTGERRGPEPSAGHRRDGLRVAPPPQVTARGFEHPGKRRATDERQRDGRCPSGDGGSDRAPPALALTRAGALIESRLGALYLLPAAELAHPRSASTPRSHALPRSGRSVTCYWFSATLDGVGEGSRRLAERRSSGQVRLFASLSNRRGDAFRALGERARDPPWSAFKRRHGGSPSSSPSTSDDVRSSARKGLVVVRLGKGDAYREIPLNALGGR
jgi:hypothetical protein